MGFEAARGICKQHAKTFYFASFFLPPDKRRAAYAVYAFCRFLDDAIDHPDVASGLAPASSLNGRVCGVNELDRRLQAFADRLDQVYADRLDLPAREQRSEAEHALHAFAQTVHRYDIPRAHFDDLAQGCRMDLTVKRYATWASLERYCYHVAGVVGLIMSRVFELPDRAAEQQAVRMGNAMQLTNILRDVREDWDRGRVYLPLEDLLKFGVTEADLAGGKMTDGFRELMKFEVGRAREMYREGARGLCRLPDDGSRFTASAMAVVYAGILGAVERQGHDVFVRRASLTLAQKLMRLAKARRLSRRLADEPLPAGVFE